MHDFYERNQRPEPSGSPKITMTGKKGLWMHAEEMVASSQEMQEHLEFKNEFPSEGKPIDVYVDAPINHYRNQNDHPFESQMRKHNQRSPQ